MTHIWNYELSQDPQEYIHRVGRTARAGEQGKAITLLSEQNYDAMSAILRTYDVKIKKLVPGNFKKLKFDPGKRRMGGRGFNKQSSLKMPTTEAKASRCLSQCEKYPHCKQ